jgi:hypothetical protein
MVLPKVIAGFGCGTRLSSVFNFVHYRCGILGEFIVCAASNLALLLGVKCLLNKAIN